MSGHVNPGEVVVTKIRFAPHEENGLKKLYFESSELESGENVIYGNIIKGMFIIQDVSKNSLFQDMKTSLDFNYVKPCLDLVQL